MKAKVKSLKTNLVGTTVPTTENGHAARYIEQSLAKQGFRVDTRGTLDLPDYNTEVKSRNIDATSAQTVGSMTPEHIKTTPYRESTIFKKIQQQFRVYIKEDVIVDARVVDFSWNEIQNRIEESYEAARKRIIEGQDSNYIPGGPYGYFERTVKGSNSYDFRLRDQAMKKLESMATSTFQNLFTFEK